MSIAIVTGASSGMGEEFCKALDSKGLDNLWLVARRKENLEAIASKLKTPCSIFPVDLTDRQQIDGFIDQINTSQPDIRYLVNCAGFGKFGKTWELSPDLTRSMIDLNVNALVSLTSACIPYMKRGSHIIELCSASAYVALYDLNVYASTKAFVRHFCNGLRGELKDRGISVTEVSPGWVKTDFIDITMTEQKVPEKIFKGAVTKEDVVAQAMDAADKGKKRSVCGFGNKMIVRIADHCPNLAANIWKGQFK